MYTLHYQQLSRWIPLFALGVFFIFSFSQWYVMTYTKLWELKQMVGKSAFSQMKILHPRDQMAQLIALKGEISHQNFPLVQIALPEQRTLGLSQNPPFVRGFLQASFPDKDIQIVSLSSITPQQTGPCFAILDPEVSSPSASLHHCTVWRGK